MRISDWSSDVCSSDLRFLVAEDQRLVAREEVDFVEVGLGLGVDPAGPHEQQLPLDVVGQALVALALAARRQELLVPLVDPRQVGTAALHAGPEQVQSRGGLVVRLTTPIGVSDTARKRNRLIS